MPRFGGSKPTRSRVAQQAVNPHSAPNHNTARRRLHVLALTKMRFRRSRTNATAGVAAAAVVAQPNPACDHDHGIRATRVFKQTVSSWAKGKQC